MSTSHTVDRDALQAAIEEMAGGSKVLPSGARQRLVRQFGCSHQTISEYLRRWGYSVKLGAPPARAAQTKARQRLDALEQEAAKSPARRRELRHKILRARRAVEGRAADVAECREALRELLSQAAQSPDDKRRLRHRIRRAKNKLAEAERAKALAQGAAA